jgi:hypothetical protein
MLKLTWPQAAAWRARRHYLDKRAPPGSMLSVAGRLCGLHAQVMSSAELSVWARVEDLERGAIQRALWQDRTLVKTWAMRGTLHLLPADELGLWHAALRTSRRYLREAAWQNYFGITIKDLDKLTEAIGVALDGRVMTREELTGAVRRLTRSPALAGVIANSSWGTVLKPAAFTGRLCFGPSLGQLVRFTSPNSWLTPRPEAVDPQYATAEITRRFLAANGPVTYHDLARWWNGGGVSNARQWITYLGQEVTRVVIDGAPAWMLATDEDEAREFSATATRSARLLPGFDQYVVAASRHAEHLLPSEVPRAVIYRPQGWISPVLLVNGMMHGTWNYEVKRGRVEVTIEPFLKIPLWARRETILEAERLAAFLGCSLNLSWKGRP